MVISLQTARGKPLALFANYALHYVGAVPRGQVSADYFGEFSRLMPSRLRAGEEFVAMMSNGASGDIEQTIHRADPPLAMREREITLKYRKPTFEQIQEAKDILAISDEGALARLPRRAVPYAERTLRAAERDETVTVKLQAIRIGDFAVCGIPFETLVEIGLELKERSPFEQTMVIGLANGRFGYLPTPRQHRLGGYETWLGTNYVQTDASEIITENLLEMLAELAED